MWIVTWYKKGTQSIDGSMTFASRIEAQDFARCIRSRGVQVCTFIA